MPKAGRGQLEDPKGRAGSCPEQLSPLSTFCQGTAWPQAPRGPERSRCQPPPAPPGHLSHKPNYGLSTAVRSLIERPWGEGTAETVKYPEGDTAIPSQNQNMATPLSPAHARVGRSRGAEETTGSSSLNPTLLSPCSPSLPCPSTIISSCSSHRPFHRPAEQPLGLSHLLSVPTGLRLGLPLFPPH